MGKPERQASAMQAIQACWLMPGYWPEFNPGAIPMMPELRPASAAFYTVRALALYEQAKRTADPTTAVILHNLAFECRLAARKLAA